MTYVKLNQVVKRYQMGESVVTANDGVDFEINKGEFVIIVGPVVLGNQRYLIFLGEWILLIQVKSSLTGWISRSILPNN